jgi:hypothetical protein
MIGSALLETCVIPMERWEIRCRARASTDSGIPAPNVETAAVFLDELLLLGWRLLWRESTSQRLHWDRLRPDDGPPPSALIRRIVGGRRIITLHGLVGQARGKGGGH